MEDKAFYSIFDIVLVTLFDYLSHMDWETSSKTASYGQAQTGLPSWSV